MLSRTILLTATALASATAVVGLGSTPAQAATDQVHVYQFVNAHHSDKDLAVLNASTAPGQPIVQFSRNNGENQQWEIINLPSTPAPGFAPDRQIKNRLSGLCLDVANNSLSSGAAIVQNPCNVGDPAQHWIVPKLARSSARTVASATTSTRTRAWPWTLPAGPPPTTRRSSSSPATVA